MPVSMSRARARNVFVRMADQTEEIDVRIVMHAQAVEMDLTELSLDVLQAVEEHAADLAFGAVASADLDNRTIALVFQIEATNEVLYTLQRIADVIEAKCGIRLRDGSGIELRRAPAARNDLVTA